MASSVGAEVLINLLSPEDFFLFKGAKEERNSSMKIKSKIEKEREIDLKMAKKRESEGFEKKNGEEDEVGRDLKSKKVWVSLRRIEWSGFEIFMKKFEEI